jgi:hypothetical protein
VPVVFIALAVLLIANTIWTTPKPSAIGLGVTAIGGLVYLVFYRGKFRPDDPAIAPSAAPSAAPPGELPGARVVSE